MSKIIELMEKLPPELEEEVIDFIEFLINKRKLKKITRNYDVKEVSKFAGILKELSVEPLEYQENLRKEWE